MGGRVNQRLTVLQAVPALQGGGVERSTLEVAAALVRNGHRSLVISAGGRLVPELLDAGSEHVCWPIGRKSPLTLRLVPRLRRLLHREGVDILHARSRLPAWVAWLAWRGMDPARRPRFITTVHGLNSVNAYSAVMLKGEQVVAVSAQYMYAVIPPVAGYLFVDVGKPFREYDSFDFKKLRTGFGGGFQLMNKSELFLRMEFSSSTDGGFIFNLTFEPVFNVNR